MTTLATTSVMAASEGGSDARTMVLSGGTQHAEIRFDVTGRPPAPFYPGVTRRIKITVSNPSGSALVLRSIDGRLARTSRHGCPATPATLRIRGYDGNLPVTVRPYSRQKLPGSVVVTMPKTASAACSGSRLVISLAAVGSKAHR